MKEIILSEDDIKEICQRIGKQLTDLFKDDKIPPVFIGVLKGASPFMMDLIKEVKCDIELDFVQYSSYSKTESTGVVVMKKDIDVDIKDRNVVVIEDIIDTGRTMDKFLQYLASYSPKKIYTCVLLDKPSRREVKCEADFVGKTIENAFVVGYGLDYREYFRNTKVVYKVSPDCEMLADVDRKLDNK